MIQFSEVIQLLNGELQRLNLHQQRVNRTTQHYYHSEISLRSLPLQIPSSANQGLYKCRLVYDTEIREVQFTPYTPKIHQHVMLVDATGVDYSYKFCDRTRLNQLSHRYDVDDLILIQDGCVTDSLYTNLIFENSDGYFTPDTPLLQGTRRQYLLDSGRVSLAHITLNNLHHYQKVYFVNAMMNIGDIPPLDVKNISISLY